MKSVPAEKPIIWKALSIKQPWAWAIIYAGKDIENRTWKADYKGRFLVHASQSFDLQGWKWIREHQAVLGITDLPDIHHFQRGGIIGSVDLVKCQSRARSVWFFGPYGFKLRLPQAMEFKPCKGRLGFFNVEMEVKDFRRLP